MAKKQVKHLTLDSILLYPKEKWNWKTIIRAILVFLFIINILFTPASFFAEEIGFYESLLDIFFNSFFIILWTPKINLWLEDKFNIKLSSGIRLLIFFILLMTYGMLLPAI